MENKGFYKRVGVLLLGFATALSVTILLYVLAQKNIAIPCLFNRLTGLQCPGCGNTRAALSLLRLDFSAAFGYNPMFLPEFLYIGWVLFFCCRSYLKGRGFVYRTGALWLDITLLTAVLLWWVVRNLI